MRRVSWIFLAAGLLIVVSISADGPLNGGDPNCDGSNNVSDLTYIVSYLFQGGAAPCDLGTMTTPIAYGTIQADGTIYRSSGNVSVEWDGLRYRITIDGHSYYYLTYITQVTPMAASPILASTSSGGGQLTVYLYDLAGTRVQGNFQFVVYQM